MLTEKIEGDEAMWKDYTLHSNASRKRRSKRSLNKFTAGGRDIRKLNELIYASTNWCLDKYDLSVKDYRVFLSDINFISHRACDDVY